MAVHETPTATLTASIMSELAIADTRPPRDEYAVQGPPPAYFEAAYSRWCNADKAKQAIAALDNDPAVAAAEEELKEAKEALKVVKEKSQEAFQALHTRRNLFTSFRRFGKSKRKSSHQVQGDSAPDSSVHETVTKNNAASGTSASGNHSHMDGNNLAAEEFKRAHEAERNQDLVVQDIQEKVTKFKLKREALSDVASSGNLAWIQLHQIADEVLLGKPGFAMGMIAAKEKLEVVDNAYDTAKKTASDFTRARLAVQSSHRYMTRALQICDSVRGTAVGRAVLGGLSEGVNQFGKAIDYQQSVTMASKAQICLNEVFRVLEPYERMIPDNRMEDYKGLKKMGVMQMSKIYNLLFGGRMMATGIAGSVKLMLERQEAAFAHLTHLAVWIQEFVPVCTMDEETALVARDNVRREIAASWAAIIDCGGGE